MLYITFNRYILLVTKIFTQRQLSQAQQTAFNEKFLEIRKCIKKRLELMIHIPMMTELSPNELEMSKRMADWVDELLREKVPRRPSITAKQAQKNIESIHYDIRSKTSYGEKITRDFFLLLTNYDNAVRNQFGQQGIFLLPDETEIPIATDAFLARLMDEIQLLIATETN
ncbi:MAG: hypothetical protein Q7R65_03335 [bacterium]|nr:hypothetical protein [bacterium]